MNIRQEKERLLEEMGIELSAAAQSGVLTPEYPIPMELGRIVTIAGPTAGALELYCSLDAGRIKQALGKNDCAMLRQFFSWVFPGEPSCYMSGKAVRVEAPWPSELVEKEIRLSEISLRPRCGPVMKKDGTISHVARGRWVAGQSETGRTVTLGFNDSTPNFLAGGTTGSGKSNFMRATGAQLGAQPEYHRLVLIDGKHGDGLRSLESLPATVAPIAVDIPATRDALGWAISEMMRRYREYDSEEARREREPLVVVIMDEFQEFTVGLMKDKMITTMLRTYAAQCRAANMGMLIGTHHPVQKMFGGQVTRQLFPGRVAFTVTNQDASRVLIGGSNPRADRLREPGDAYIVTPVQSLRAKVVWLPPEDLARLPTGGPIMGEFPPFNPSSVDSQLGEAEKRVQWAYEGEELGIGLIQTHLEEDGRSALIRALKERGYSAGAVRATRLQNLIREAYKMIRTEGWTLCWEEAPSEECGQMEEQILPPEPTPAEKDEMEDYYDGWMGLQSV